jgi:hypothetical protein
MNITSQTAVNEMIIIMIDADLKCPLSSSKKQKKKRHNIPDSVNIIFEFTGICLI